MARLPDNVDVQRPLAGTFKTLLDGQALAQGSLATALKHDVPLAIDRQVKVLKTSSNTALVSDARTTTAAGTKVEQTTWQYAVDRRNLEPSTHHPSNWSVVDAHGLTISFPFGAKKQAYTGWVPETATTTPVTYTRSEQRSGLQTYVYQANVTPTRITDSQVLAGLPKALPQSQLKLLVQFGPLTPDQQQKLTALLPTLGDPARSRTPCRATTPSGSSRRPARCSTSSAPNSARLLSPPPTAPSSHCSRSSTPTTGRPRRPCPTP